MQHFPGLIAALALALAAAAPQALAGLPAPVAKMLSEAGIPEDGMGAVVMRLATGEIVRAHRADQPFAPASTLKVLTSIVALERLGPAWRGTTAFWSDAPVKDGVLEGHLVLRGGADADFDAPALHRLMRSLRNQGIREIAGDLVVDRTLFDPPRADAGAPPFDETPEFRYNVIPDALLLATNLVQLELSSAAGALSVLAWPPLENVAFDPAMALVERACDKWEDGWLAPTVGREADGTLRVRLRGEFPKGCTAATSVSVIDREDYAERLLRATWRELGGTLRGTVREASAPGGRKLAEHASRTLAEITRDINKRSDNPVTRLVYLALGTMDVGPAGGPTAGRADKRVREWLKEKGIGDEGLVLDNGSGLSRKERIRPDTLARVLRAARSSPWAPEYVAAFPIVGVDGGMRRRLKDSPAAQRSRIKTGTLRDVSAVAGYVDDASGETYAVVAMINHPAAKGSVARPILDAYLDAVARGGAKAGTAKTARP